MRMNQDMDMSAAVYLNQKDGNTLQDIFKKYGEIWNANKVVTAILDYRKKNKLRPSGNLCRSWLLMQ